VVFAAGDGELYQYEFDRRFGVSLPEDSSDAAPCPLVWRERPRRLTRARFNDPFTSSSIQGGSALLVSARIASGYDSEEVLARDEIWYLALDSTGREILHATLVCAPAANDPLALRHPTWVDRESPWLVHYRPSTVHAGTWDMRAAPAEIDTSTGTPRAFLDRGITLASACRLIAPPLTADGRHVGFIRASDPAARLEFTSLPEQNDDEVARTN
jgi:hypothetical protein